MEIHVGFEMVVDCPRPTPMILDLDVHFTRLSDLIGPGAADVLETERSRG
jgi:hypothetical protein